MIDFLHFSYVKKMLILMISSKIGFHVNQRQKFIHVTYNLIKIIMVYYHEMNYLSNLYFCLSYILSSIFRYNSSTLTPIFITRVFQECLTYGGEMDYKSYLDFVLALDNRNSPQGLRYLFQIMDIDNKGYLHPGDLNFFYRVLFIFLFVFSFINITSVPDLTVLSTFISIVFITKR